VDAPAGAGVEGPPSTGGVVVFGALGVVAGPLLVAVVTVGVDGADGAAPVGADLGFFADGAGVGVLLDRDELGGEPEGCGPAGPDCDGADDELLAGAVDCRLE
jgi:hypothetical protein